ncbi:MAG: hypothetical protein R3303_04815 [Marinobacter sp.]|nr:hypothetical protein [Marinobacter sp.]
MERKPDMIRVVVIIFAIGLVITGFSSIQPSSGDATTVKTAAESSVFAQLFD